MKKITTLLFTGMFAAQGIVAQNIFPSTGSAGIGTVAPNASSLLEMVSTSKGLLIPRMTKAQRDAIATPATGLMIYQTNSTPGFYYYSGTAWTAVSSKGANTTLSNLVSPTAINQSLLPGITNSIDLGSSTKLWKNAWFSGDATINNLTVGAGGGSVIFNTAIGSAALLSNTTGTSNSAIGFNTLRNNTTGYYNTANGASALAANTTGYFNTATGAASLVSNTTGYNNIADGYATLFSNTTGYSNIAIGNGALYKNTTGYSLVAIGDSSLFNQSINPYSYYSNTAVGSKTLYSNTTGDNNTATGYKALYSNTIGILNTANGTGALQSNTTGNFNTANGSVALYNNALGDNNTANGSGALQNNTSGSNNTANGNYALLTNNTGNDNTALGRFANVSAGDYSNATVIGSLAFGTASNQVRIGNDAITSIGGYADWTNISDGRVKKNIKENVPGLAFINKLKPVTYNLNLDAADKIIQRPEIKDKDGKAMQEKASPEQLASRKAKEQIIYTGFVAQEVEKAANELSYDFSGVDAAKNDKDLYGLRYASFVVPLVKAVQELSKANDALQQQNTDLEKRMQQLEAMMNVQSTTTTNVQSVKINNASLEQNIPNPFNHSTTINYTLPQQYSNAKIIITDNAGKSIKEINVTGKAKGSVTVDASSLSAGAYHYSLYVDGKIISSKQMVLAK